jgi:hypothetical protein
VPLQVFQQITPVVVAVVDGFPIGLAALVVRAAAATAVVAAVLITEGLDHRTLVAVVVRELPVVLLLERVVRESWWCVMHCQMFRYQIFMQQTT